MRFFASWFSFFAILGSFSICPFCGQPGCPGGAADAGILGGLATVVLWLSGILYGFLQKISRKRKDKM